MTGSEGQDTLRHDLDELVETLPPPLDLPDGFAARARRRRGARVAGTGLSLVVLGVGASLAIAHGLPGGKATVKVPAATQTLTTPKPAGHATRPAAAAHALTPGLCTVADLTVSLGRANGTAGSTYYPLRFHNRSAAACTLTGYPGVSFVNSVGQQVGAPASRDAVAPAVTFVIPAGATDAAAVQVTDPYNYGCPLVHVAGLRVYPPESRTAVFLPLAGLACSTQVTQLHVLPLSGNTTGQP